MKKIFLIFALFAISATSLLAGTVVVYTKDGVTYSTVYNSNKDCDDLGNENITIVECFNFFVSSDTPTLALAAKEAIEERGFSNIPIVSQATALSHGLGKHE